MAFFFLVAATMTLFVRPTEILPGLSGLPVYNALVVACLAFAYPAVLRRAGPRSLAENPIDACVAGVLVAVVLSHLGNGNFQYAREMGLEFSKVFLYYLILVGVLDSAERLRKFMAWLVVMVVVVSALSLLNYYGLVALDGLEHFRREEVDATTGEVYEVRQLQGPGIFADPNDLCLILVTGMGFALYRLTAPGGGLFSRLPWAAAVALSCHVLTLTYSRGGFLALLAGTVGLFRARVGTGRTLAACVLLLPLAFFLVGGRQTNIDASSGSGQSRIQLWSLSLSEFALHPVFGVGQGLLAETIGQESHNSFIHCFPDIGFAGGAFFLGVYGNAFATVGRLRRGSAWIADPELRRMLPYLTAVLTGYTAGMLTISRSYIIPTYIVPGLVAAYARLAAADWGEPLGRFDARHAARLAAAAVGLLALSKVLVPLFTRWG